MVSNKKLLREQLGAQIQNRRNNVHMTQEDLAEKAGTSLENLRKIEQGRGLPGLLLFVNIARVLGSNTDELLVRREERDHINDESTALHSLYLKLSPAGRSTLIAIGEQLLLLERKIRGK